MANNTNTTGQINADTAIYNTVNVANGGTNLSATPANGQLPIGNGSGYALATLTAGTGIGITNGAGTITIGVTGAGTVTSIATGNGLSGGTITTSGTLTIAAPGFNTVGSYCLVGTNNNTTQVTAGSNYSAGASTLQIRAYNTSTGSANILSGTWKWMGSTVPPNPCGDYAPAAVGCRVA